MTGRRALAHDFTVVVDRRDATDDAFARYVDRALAALPEAAAARHVYEISHHTPGFELTLDGTALATAPDHAEIVTELLHAVNHRAIASWDGVVCHAGGVARGGDAFVFPAQMEWGKTTLTAGLVRFGFDYLSDEAIAFTPDTNVVEPYPKPLSLDRGAWPLFPELDPRAEWAEWDGAGAAHTAGQ